MLIEEWDILPQFEPEQDADVELLLMRGKDILTIEYVCNEFIVIYEFSHVMIHAGDF